MKKWYPLIISMVLLAGCTPGFGSDNKVVQKSNNKKETSVVSSYQISDQYYKNIYPYKTSKSRGLVVSNLNTSYDIEEFETGLMRVAQRNYPPDDYLFQEGQYLTSDTITKWLNRKYTANQLKKKGLKEQDNVGLNPVNDGKGSAKQQNEKNPIYLAGKSSALSASHVPMILSVHTLLGESSSPASLDVPVTRQGVS